MEIWKDIPEYDGYQVSNYGRVKRLPYEQVRNLKQGKVLCRFKGGLLSIKNGKVYKQVFIKDKTYTVHSLVMKSFIGSKPDGYVIDHIDNNPLNNNLDNLQYTTYFVNNTKDREFKTTNVRGVHYCKSKDKWICRITKNKKRIHLGTFKTEEEAIKKLKEYDNTL